MKAGINKTATIKLNRKLISGKPKLGIIQFHAKYNITAPRAMMPVAVISAPANDSITIMPCTILSHNLKIIFVNIAFSFRVKFYVNIMGKVKEKIIFVFENRFLISTNVIGLST